MKHTDADLCISDPSLCAQCAMHIYGRTVTAAGARFHPECFKCYHCSEALECVQFYPEPSHERDERLERIERRYAGEDVPPLDRYTLEEDNDDALRFYCHLDYHEFFSPRCRNCKTPIEGECVVALGGQYHPGHFFCANCGDVSFTDLLASKVLMRLGSLSINKHPLSKRTGMHGVSIATTIVPLAGARNANAP